jgi:hypothetical protein
MNEIELKQFKKLFNTIDITTPSSVKKWFLDFPELTTGEHCMIMDRSPSVIERLKRECGVTSIVVVEVEGGFMCSAKPPARKKPTKVQQTVANYDDEWVVKQYIGGKSLNWIRSACGCSPTKIYNILNTNKIVLRSHKQAVCSDNEYCSKQWLITNYIDNKYPMRKCAELAGVSHCTIRYWLAKFKLDVRSQHETGSEI